MIDRRQLLIGSAMLGAAGAAAILRPRDAVDRVAPGLLDDGVPDRVGTYQFATTRGLTLPSADEMTGGLYDQVLTRVYAAPDQAPVMLAIAYGRAQDAGSAVHRPEACYLAQGYHLSPGTAVPLAPALPGQHGLHFTATRGDRNEQVLYWIRIGDHFPASRWAQKEDVVAANLRGIRPDGIMVRLSVRDSDAGAALLAMRRFNTLMVDGLAPGGRRLLLGAA